MMIIEWSPINETEWIPPFGDELIKHIKGKKGSDLYASCSAWRLLYQTLIANGLEIGEVVFEEGGKPYFKNRHIHFSLSHSHRLCVIAVSNHPVGVDIEIVKDHYNQHLIERSLCAHEKAIFDGDFTLFWTCKEAVAKKTGNGIISYPVDIDTTKYRFIKKRISFGGKEYWCSVTGGDSEELCIN